MTIDRMEEILNEIAEEIPKDFYKYLNGGILLIPDCKIHPKAVNNDLFVLGEYHIDRDLGRYIIIYYGSFQYIYGYLPEIRLREKLKEVLVHEFTHHLESLAGERDLEIKDAAFIEKHKKYE